MVWKQRKCFSSSLCKKIGGHFCLVTGFREQQRNRRPSEHQSGHPGSYSPYLRSELLADITSMAQWLSAFSPEIHCWLCSWLHFLLGALIPVTQCQSHSDSIRDLLFQSLLSSTSKCTEYPVSPSFILPLSQSTKVHGEAGALSRWSNSRTAQTQRDFMHRGASDSQWHADYYIK